MNTRNTLTLKALKRKTKLMIATKFAIKMPHASEYEMGDNYNKLITHTTLKTRIEICIQWYSRFVAYS